QVSSLRRNRCPVCVEYAARALKALHEGVKYGCRTCAGNLWIEFNGPANHEEMLAPYIDKARGERYRILSNALDVNPDRRFPNLDKVLPLPPAQLPSWDGKRDTLLKAAMGVSVIRTPPQKPGVASHVTERSYLDPDFTLRHRGVTTTTLHAPATAYWKPAAAGQADHIRAILAGVAPGLYRAGETFETFSDQRGENKDPLPGVVWERWDTVRHNHGDVDTQAAPGLTRQVTRPAVPLVCTQALCPQTGIWQPWIDPEYPMAAAINQHWRQSWLERGQPFPRPALDWLPALPDDLISWHLMDSLGVQLA
ncbi:MAG: DUF6396 domain-containing protein, partial [Pseudomonadota bacterium]